MKRVYLVLLIVCSLILIVLSLSSAFRAKDFGSLDLDLIGAEYPNDYNKQVEYYIVNAKYEIDEFKTYKSHLEEALESNDLKKIEVTFNELHANFYAPDKPLKDNHFANSYIKLMDANAEIIGVSSKLEEYNKVNSQQDVNYIKDSLSKADNLVREAEKRLLDEYDSYN